MTMQCEIIVPRLEFKVIPPGKNSRAHTEWKCKMFFNVYLTTNTPVTIDVSSQKNLFLQYIWGHDVKPLNNPLPPPLSHFYFLCFSALFPLCLSHSISLSLSLFKHLSSVFSLQALCALWCWFLQLFTHQSCHLSFIDPSSQERIWNVTIALWLIVIACVVPLMSLAPGPIGPCVNCSIYTSFSLSLS